MEKNKLLDLNKLNLFGLSSIFKGGPGSGNWEGPGDPRYAHEGKKDPKDLSGQDLRGKDFSGQDLRGYNFTGANLTKADFFNSDLTGTILTDANITDANFTAVSLIRTNLTGAKVGNEIIHSKFIEALKTQAIILANLNTQSAEENKAYVQSEIAKATNINYDKIRYFVSEWAGTSGDNNIESIANQLAAKEIFKLDSVKVDHWPEDKLKEASELIDSNRKAILQAQYDLTQKYFKDKGVKEVLVYRGVGDSYKGESSIDLQPISSFSLDYGVAKNFGHNVFAARVPVEKILSHPRTGFGCTNESEIVVLGGRTNVLRVNNFLEANELYIKKKEIGLGMFFKGGVGSGIRGHRTYRAQQPKKSKHWQDVSEQLDKNLLEIADGKAKRILTQGQFNEKNIKSIINNMRNEADLYTSYLASDTAVKLRDMTSIYENILYEGLRNGEFKDINTKDLDDFGIDNIKKMVHQEVESNRQQFTDHGIRHIFGNTQRQIEIMNQMGKTSAMDKLSAMAIMVNHDMGYTTAAVRKGGVEGIKISSDHKTFSGEIINSQRSILNEGKLFSSKQFDRVSEAIKTHDSTEFSKDNLLNSTRISDNLALFAKEKLPSMFKYVKGGAMDLVNMGEAAKNNDIKSFEILRTSLYKKIDGSNLNVNLKRDLKAGAREISLMTPKFSMGVLAGEIDSISGGKGKVNVIIKYSKWDAFLQTRFDMGQKQTKKLLNDYGITDFSKTNYNIGGIINLKVVGIGGKEIGLSAIFKHLPGQHDQLSHGGGGFVYQDKRKAPLVVKSPKIKPVDKTKLEFQFRETTSKNEKKLQKIMQDFFEDQKKSVVGNIKKDFDEIVIKHRNHPAMGPKPDKGQHISSLPNIEQAIYLAQEAGINLVKAKSMVRAIRDYTNGDFYNIRIKKNDGYIKKAELLEEFIEKFPKFKGEVLYRGSHIDKNLSVFAKMNIGSVIGMRGISSWSSNQKIAKQFSSSTPGDRNYLFEMIGGTNKGASISFIHDSEQEVLVSGKSRFKVESIEEVGKHKWDQLMIVKVREIEGVHTKSIDIDIDIDIDIELGDKIYQYNDLQERWSLDSDLLEVFFDEGEKSFYPLDTIEEQILAPSLGLSRLLPPKKRVLRKGGPGSGNFGHSGRPGEVGGSGEGDNGIADESGKNTVASLIDSKDLLDEIDKIRTDPSENVIIQYKDGSYVKLPPGSEFSVDELPDANPDEWMIIHNHPNSAPPSAADIRTLVIRPANKMIIVVKGKSWIISKTKDTPLPPLSEKDEQEVRLTYARIRDSESYLSEGRNGPLPPKIWNEIVGWHGKNLAKYFHLNWVGKKEQDNSSKKTIKGGPGSGNWNGPGDPRYAHEDKKEDINDVILKYQNGAYQSINGFLRGENIEENIVNKVKQDIQILDESMSFSSGDKYLFRGDGAGISSSLFDMISNLPHDVKAEDVLFGGKIDGENYNDFFTEKLKGVEFTDKAFLSTSSSHSVAMDKFVYGATSFSKFGASGLVQIFCPKGTKMIDVEKVSIMGAKEKEFILARGNKLRIDKVTFEPLQHKGIETRFYIKWQATVVSGSTEQKEYKIKKFSLNSNQNRFIWGKDNIIINNGNKSLGISAIFKHLPGQHDQRTHAPGGLVNQDDRKAPIVVKFQKNKPVDKTKLEFQFREATSKNEKKLQKIMQDFFEDQKKEVLGLLKKDFDEIEQKHLSGQHDQLSHGDRAGSVDLQEDGAVYVYRGEYIGLKDKILKNGIPKKSWNNRPASVYMTTDEKEAHMYGIDKSFDINKNAEAWEYLVVKIKIPKNEKIIPDERDTIYYGRPSAIRIERSIPKDWIFDVSSYRGFDSYFGKTSAEIADIMMKKSIEENFAYIAFVIVPALEVELSKSFYPLDTVEEQLLLPSLGLSRLLPPKKRVLRKDINEITQEMVDHFNKRTELHISLVQKYLQKIIDLNNSHLDQDVLEEEKNHDQSKYSNPEYTAYLHVNWHYYLESQGETYDPSEDIKNQMDEATFHHVKNNKHHPEYWDENSIEDSINRENRDETPENIVDATKMPLTYVASMVADWLAMSEEKETDPYKWLNKNVNKRWKFTDEQIELIKDLLNNCWNNGVEKSLGLSSIFKGGPGSGIRGHRTNRLQERNEFDYKPGDKTGLKIGKSVNPTAQKYIKDAMNKIKSVGLDITNRQILYVHQGSTGERNADAIFMQGRVRIARNTSEKIQFDPSIVLASRISGKVNTFIHEYGHFVDWYLGGRKGDIVQVDGKNKLQSNYWSDQTFSKLKDSGDYKEHAADMFVSYINTGTSKGYTIHGVDKQELSLLYKHFDSAMKSLSSKQKSFLFKEVVTDRFDFSGWSFDKEIWNKRLQEEGGLFIKEMYDQQGVAAYDGLKYYVMDLVGAFNIEDPRVQEFLKNYIFTFAKGINDTTEELLREAMQSGMAEGLGMDGIANKIEGLYDTWGKWRSLLIARTETIRASNGATVMAYEQSGVVNGKEWLVTQDDRTCFPANTSVKTIDGYKGIQDVQVGDLVLTHKDRYRKVVKTHLNLHMGDFIRIYYKSNRGNRRLVCTPNHPILINGEWKKAEDIIVGDKVLHEANPCGECGKLTNLGRRYCSPHCQAIGMNKTLWEDPLQHERVSRQNKEFGKGKLMKSLHEERRQNDPGYKENWVNSVSNGNKKHYESPENREKRAEINRKTAQYPTHPFKAITYEQRTENLKKIMKTRGKNHLGKSFLEKKVKWWLEQNNYNFEEQKYFNNGERRFWVDFYLPDYNIIIEADGEYFHSEQDDRKRDAALIKCFTGQILHFTQSNIMRNFGRCIFKLNRAISAQNCFVESAVMKVERVSLDSKVKQPVYNLTVEEDNSYVASRIVVHNCDFCLPMDGKVVDLNKNFFNKGDSYVIGEGDNKVTMKLDYEDVGYPPLHPNCRCALVPFISEEYQIPKSLGLSSIFKGGPGSGNFGHEGRPGEVGGSGVGGFGDGILNLTPEQLADSKKANEILNRDVFFKERPIENKKFVQAQISKAIKDHPYFKMPKKDWPADKPTKAEFYVKNEIDQWAKTSGDSDIRSIGLQIVAKEIFNLGEATLDHLGASKLINVDHSAFQDAKYNIDAERPLPFNQDGTYKLKDIQGRFLQAQYDATQKYFKDNNIKELILYRGVEHNDAGKLRTEDISLQPMSSFSTNVDKAFIFANITYTSKYLNDSMKGTIYVSRIPVEKILSHPRTGFGCTDEKEVVVLGGKMKATIIPTKIAINIKETAFANWTESPKESFNDRFIDALNKVTPEFRKAIGLSRIFKHFEGTEYEHDQFTYDGVIGSQNKTD